MQPPGCGGIDTPVACMRYLGALLQIGRKHSLLSTAGAMQMSCPTVALHSRTSCQAMTAMADRSWMLTWLQLVAKPPVANLAPEPRLCSCCRCLSRAAFCWRTP